MNIVIIKRYNQHKVLLCSLEISGSSLDGCTEISGLLLHPRFLFCEYGTMAEQLVYFIQFSRSAVRETPTYW
jgi:hypothetical protein